MWRFLYNSMFMDVIKGNFSSLAYTPLLPHYMQMEPFALVIFGITGNLAQKKLLPAISDLKKRDLLPENFKIIGIGRKPITGDFDYIQGDLTDPALYKSIKDKTVGMNTMFYLATYPDLYKTVFDHLAKMELNHQDKHSVRLIIEKPFGNDFSSAKKLNKLLLKYFTEDQIFRIDHYLGKETLQNMLTFRFGNSIFEELMNKKYIDHIQITSAETIGIEGRGGYYDSVGALKDIGQNHLLQMLALAAMDAPKRFTNEDITRARMNVLKRLKPFPDSLVLGQYEGYKEEESVEGNSQTNTFFAFKTTIDSKRLQGVPIYIRGGKKLAKYVSEIAIVFKKTTESINRDIKGEELNVLTYRLQPDEGISIRMMVKSPGHTRTVEPTTMQFKYSQLGKEIPSAYERLLHDAMQGDQTFFNDAPEIEAQWKFIDSLVIPAKEGYSPREENHTNRVIPYKEGSWGPKEANKLIEKDGRYWLGPSV
jgi:glucose-6-phosphate 1-dehydrogenase